MYENDKCQYCGEQFAKNDDIVVCPDCGAPYHRRCWEEHGKCAFESRHGQGFEYNKQTLPKADTTDDKGEEDFIEKVKNEILKDSKPSQTTATCECCGSNLISQDGYCLNCTHKQGEPVDEKKLKKAIEKNPFKEVEPDEIIAGEKAADIALVVRSNSAKFLPKMKKIDGKKFKVGWSWPAFFFGYLYLFFRKLYKYGVIVILAEVLIFNVLNVALGDPIKAIQQQSAASYTAYSEAANDASLDDEAKLQAQMKVISDMNDTLSKDHILQKAYGVVFGSLILCNVASALLFNYLYLRHCSETIKRMNKSAEMLGGMSGKEYKFNLLARGGVSVFGLFLGYFLRAAVEYLIAALLSMF